MTGYAKQKLYEAVHALVGRDEIQRRLTFATVPMIHLQDRDIPETIKVEFEAVKRALLRTPLADPQRGYLPRQISDEEAELLAQRILGLLTEVMGGL